MVYKQRRYIMFLFIFWTIVILVMFCGLGMVVLLIFAHIVEAIWPEDEIRATNLEAYYKRLEEEDANEQHSLLTNT